MDISLLIAGLVAWRRIAVPMVGDIYLILPCGLSPVSARVGLIFLSAWAEERMRHTCTIRGHWNDLMTPWTQ